jgi:hypothetical protein
VFALVDCCSFVEDEFYDWKTTFLRFLSGRLLTVEVFVEIESFSIILG